MAPAPRAFEQVRPLRSDADYTAALSEYEAYFGAEPLEETQEGDRFELLGLVIAQYEQGQLPAKTTDPVDVIRQVMKSRGFGQDALALALGSRSRASEILNRKRALSIDHIRRLHKAWNIPLENLIGGLDGV